MLTSLRHNSKPSRFLLYPLAFIFSFLLCLPWVSAKETPKPKPQDWQINGIVAALDDGNDGRDAASGCEGEIMPGASGRCVEFTCGWHHIQYGACLQFFIGIGTEAAAVHFLDGHGQGVFEGRFADGVGPPHFFSVKHGFEGDVLPFGVPEGIGKFGGYVELYGNTVGGFTHHAGYGQLMKMCGHSDLFFYTLQQQA